MFGDSWGSYDSGGNIFGGSYDYSNNFQGPVPYNPFDYDYGFDSGTDYFSGMEFDPGLSGFYGDDFLPFLGFDSNTFDYDSGLFDTNLTLFHQDPDTAVTYFNPLEQDPSVFLDPNIVLYDPESDTWKTLVDQDGNPTDPEVYDGGQLPDFVVRASDELPIAAVSPGAPDDMIENPLDLTFRTINEAVEQDQAEDQDVFGFAPTQGFTGIIRDQLKENAKPLTSGINKFGETVFNATDGTQYVVRKPVPGGQNKWVEYEEGVTEAPTNGLRGAAEPITFPTGTTLNPYTGKLQYSTRSEIPTGMESSTGPLGPGSVITTRYEWDPANPDTGWQVSDRDVFNENEELVELAPDVSLPEPDPVPPDLEEAVNFERPELSPTDLVYENAYDPTTYEVPQGVIDKALERIDNDLASSETLGVQFQTLPLEQRETFEELVRGYIENNQTFSDSTDINANLNQALAAAADAVTQDLVITSDDDPENAYNQVNAEFIFNDIIQSGGETVDQTLERINAPSTTFTNEDKREEVQNLFKDNNLNNLFFVNSAFDYGSAGPGIDLNKYNTDEVQDRIIQNSDQLYNELVKAFPEYNTPSQTESLQKRALKVATVVEVAAAARDDDSTINSLARTQINELFGGSTTSNSKSEVMAKLMKDGVALGSKDNLDTGDYRYPGLGQARTTFNLSNGFKYTIGWEPGNPSAWNQNTAEIRSVGADKWWTDRAINSLDNSVNPSLAPADASGFTDYTAGIAAGRQEAIDTALAQGIQFTQGDIDDAVALATQGLFTNEQQQAAVQAAVTKAIEDTINRGDIYTQAELDAATTLATNNATKAVADAGIVFNQADIDAAVERGRLNYIDQGYTYRAEDVQNASEQGYAAGEAAVTAQFAAQGIQFTQADINTAVTTAIQKADIDGQKQEAARLAVEDYIRNDDTIYTKAELTAAAQAATDAAQEAFNATGKEFTQAELKAAVQNGVDTYKAQGFTFTESDVNTAREEGLAAGVAQQVADFESKGIQFTQADIDRALLEKETEFGVTLSAAEAAATAKAISDTINRTDIYTQEELEALISNASTKAVQTYIDSDETIYTEADIQSRITDAINSLTADELTALMPEVEIYRPDVEAARAAETELLGRRDFRFFQEGVENLGQAENQAKLAQWLEDGVNQNTYRDIERQVIAIGVENDDTFTMADRILDTAVNGFLDGGLDPLNSIAAAINLAEGITGANIADIPNVGQMLGNALGDKVDDTIKGLLNRFTPEFFRNAIAQQTGYLGQDVNIIDNILADPSYAAQIRTGLPPATQQLEEYNKIVFESLFVDPSTGEAAISWDSLTPNEKVGFSENASDYLNSLTQPEEGDIDFGDGPLATLFKPIIGAEGLASSAIQGIGNFLEDVAFNQKKFVGGLAPKFLLDTAIGGFTGVPLPYSFLSDMLLSPFAPTGQALSDYLYEQGINPLTATMDDISFFGGGSLEGIPEGFLTRDEDYLRNALEGVAADTPSLFSPFVGEGTLLENLLSGETNLIDFVGGLGSEALNNIFGGGGDGGDGEGFSAFQDDPPANTVNNPDPDGTAAIFDEFGNPIGGTSPGDGMPIDTGEGTPPGTGSPVDGNGNINTGTNMEEDDTEDFDLSYEIAKSIGGTEFAEGYRNVGLQGVLGITDDYQEAQARAALGTQADIAEQQQSVADRLRDLYLTSNIGAIDRFGQPMRDAVSSLRPEATAAIDATRDIFEQQRDRALGRLSARDLAEARNEAFVRSQATGRFEDPVGQLETLTQLANVRARNEQLALDTGARLANQEAARQGDLTSLIIGQSPFTAGIQQVDVPFGGADLFNIGAQNYQNVAQQQQYNQATDIANRNMAAIPQASQPSGVQRVANFANDLSTGLSAYQFLFGPGDGSGGALGQLYNTITNTVNPSSSSGYVNPGSFSTDSFVPQQNVDYGELYDPLNPFRLRP